MSDQILVLVVEDEALVRVVLVDVLEEAGFRMVHGEHLVIGFSVQGGFLPPGGRSLPAPAAARRRWHAAARGRAAGSRCRARPGTD